MYYAERVFVTSTALCGTFTMINLFYIKKNYFANACRARIVPTWKYWSILNLVTLPLLLRPLTKEEIQIQWHKRKLMGKYIYTLYHLDGPPDMKKADE